ncbi:MAG: hypothetical protein PHP44_01175 [Kiritimatiellae bacterium]|nr:hypothetical protein [Kiritimatiellia bacterium]
MDEQKPARYLAPRELMVPVIAGIFLLLCFFVQLHGDYVLLAILAITPFVLMLFSRADIVAILVITFYFSRLYYYHIPMNLMLYQVFMLSFVGLSLAKKIISKEEVKASPCIKLGWLSIIWICFVIAVRGHALSFLGSPDAGGGAYIHIFIAFSLYLFSGYITLSEKQWKIAFSFMLLLIFVPFVVNLLFIVSRGRIWYPLLFILPGVGLADTFTAFTHDITTTRWSILHPVVLIYLFPTFLWPCKTKRHYLYYGIFFTLAGAAALLSGYRNRFLHVIAFLFLFTILNSRKPFRTAMIALTGGMLIILLMIFLAPYMPFGVQRVLAMIPGIEVSHVAYAAGSQTMEWRRYLWTLAFENIPRYFVVGRGFGYNPDLVLTIRQSAMRFPSLWGDVYGTFVGGHMHQGLLDLLIFLGAPGLCFSIVWWIGESIRHIKRQKIQWNNENLKRYHLALTVYYVVSLTQFMTYLGGIQWVYCDLIFQLALLNALIVCDQRYFEKNIF